MFEFKILLGAFILFILETINGIFRIKFLSKHISKKKVKLVSFILGLTIILIFSFLYIPIIKPKSYFDTFIIGLYWSIPMIIFDIFVGKILFKLKWEKVIDDFNIKKGNLLSLGIFLILFIPSFIFYFFK